MTLSPEDRNAAILAAARAARDRREGAANDGSEIGLIRFDIAGDLLAIPIHWVSKIERYPARISPVPNTPDFVKGVANLRGTIVPVLDLGELLGHEPAASPQGLLVLRDGPRQFGVVSATLPDYFKVAPDEIEVAPRKEETISALLSGAIRRNQLIGVLDGAKLFAVVARINDAD